MEEQLDFGPFPDALKLQWIAFASRQMQGMILHASYSKAIELDIKQRPPGSPTPSLGWISFPPEILQMILPHLDLASLRQVQAVNTDARSIVLNFSQYRDIKIHAPDLIANLYITSLASYFSVSRIHCLLTSSKCVICSQFGGYVFLPGLQRCCQRCAEGDMEFAPINIHGANKAYGVDQNLGMAALPMLISVPGQYYASVCLSTKDIMVFKDKQTLISREEARKYGIVRVGDVDDGKACKRYMSLAPMSSLNHAKSRVEKGIVCSGCVSIGKSHGRGSRECLLPNLEEVDGFVAGQPTQRHSEIDCPSRLARDRLYSVQGFLIHLEKCEHAKRSLRRMLKGVTGRLSRDPTSIPWIRQNPGVFWQTALQWQNSGDFEHPGPFPDHLAELVVGLRIVEYPRDESAHQECPVLPHWEMTRYQTDL